MKGTNELKLNTATMMQAVQEYLDKRLQPAVKVANVEGPSGSYIQYYTVTIEEQCALDAEGKAEG